MKHDFVNRQLANKIVKMFFDWGIEFSPIYSDTIIGFYYTDKRGEPQEVFPTDKGSLVAIQDSITDF